MKKKLLILGASGLTGYKIINVANKMYDVYGTFNSRPLTTHLATILKIDITDETQIKKLFTEIKPDIVINTTALHNVDFCEENYEKAKIVNYKAISNFFESSKIYDFKMIHISTDYVFDGGKQIPYTEVDAPNPINLYGKSKLQGENILLNSKHVVIRSSLVYGWSPLELTGVSSSGKPMNFAIWLLKKLHAKETVNIVSDQFTCSTLADSLADGILTISQSDKNGLYNVSGLTCESRYEFSVKFAKKFGYDSNLIKEISSDGLSQKAKRPKFSCLNSQKAINDFGLELLTTDKALDIMRNQVEKIHPELLGNN